MPFNDKMTYRKFRRKDLTDLLTPDFPFRTAAFNRNLYQRFLHGLRLIPQETNFVAYHTEKKRAIGFLQLTKHTKSIYSISCVFTNSNFRQKEVATGLLNYTMNLVKSKHGKKIFLVADYPNSNGAKLYSKLGFKPIVNTSIIHSIGFLKTLPSNNSHRLISLDTSSNKDKKVLFSIYERCMGEKWIKFFETNNNNLINGFSQDYKHSALKTAFVNESKNVLVLVFYYPPLSHATLNVYSISNDLIPSTLKELYRILKKKGINYTQITMFNIKKDEKNNKNFQIINEMDFSLYLTFMEKTI